MCKISVVVPVYNGGTLLQKCINSALSQSFDDFELLLINDGSTDGSGEVCRNAARQDARVRYIEKENGGLASVRNLAMREARGEYLCFIDCDDYVDNGCLAFLYGRAKADGADVVLCGYFLENSGSVMRIAAQPGIYTGAEINARMIELKSKNLIDTACNKLYLRSFLLQTGLQFPTGEIFEDTDFNLRLLTFSPVIAVYPDCFYHYVLHMDSITRRFNPEKLELLKRRARLLKQVTSGIDGYCDYYYVKSVCSTFMDMFLCCKKAEIRAAIRQEAQDPEFLRAAAGAEAPGFGARMIIRSVRGGHAGRIYRFCFAAYLLKYRMQKIFLRVRP